MRPILRSLTLALSWLAATSPGPALAQSPVAAPLPWQDAAPLAVPFLQLPMEAPPTLGPGRLQAELRTIHSSSIASAQSSGLRLDYQLGTTQPSLVVRLGLRDGLELHLELATVVEHDDYLSPLIFRVESWFGSARQLRRLSTSEAPRLSLVGADGRGPRFSGDQQALGDVWGGLKGRLREQEGWVPALAWRAALKLPTGRFPYGSGTLEVGAGVLGGLALGATSATLAADLMVPGGPVSSARLATRPHPAFQLALAQALTPSFAVLLQGSTHGSALRYLHLSEIDGWTFYVLGGVRVRVNNGVSVGLGLVENLVVTERGTDFAALLDVAWNP